jgi:hypothetical protein
LAETERLNDTETEMHTETESFRSLVINDIHCLNSDSNNKIYIFFQYKIRTLLIHLLGVKFDGGLCIFAGKLVVLQKEMTQSSEIEDDYLQLEKILKNLHFKYKSRQKHNIKNNMFKRHQ